MKKTGRPPNPKSWRSWDIHWRTTSQYGDDEREFVYRTIYKEDGGLLDVTAAHWRRWFFKGWEKELERLRTEQRKRGIPDSTFWPGKKKKGEKNAKRQG